MKKLILSTLFIFLTKQAFALNFIEHSFFTDLSCDLALKQLESKLHKNQSLVPKYIALSLFCPVNMEEDYCSDEYKHVKSYINRLDGVPSKTGKHSVSLGDIAAWADHIANYGPIKSYPRASREGLLLELEEWLEGEDETVGGVLEDVAEDSCESRNPVEWAKHKESIMEQLKNPIRIDSKFSMPGNRKELVKGPHDPAGLYSFDNPQYLDLILNNHHHFGSRSYETWLGFHATAIDISGKKCEDIYEGDSNCTKFRSLVKKRIQQWAKFEKIENPILLKAISALKNNSPGARDLLDRSSTALISLLFEGGGNHYLQDNFAGGHLRGNRGDLSLEDARYFHDTDNKNGVFAEFKSSTKSFSFLAYGDDYLLGPGSLEVFQDCKVKSKNSKDQAANCILKQQKAMIVAATTSSLLDWAYGGVMYEKKCDPKKNSFICENLPTKPVVSSQVEDTSKVKILKRASLPQPPPRFSYQSLSLSHAFNEDNEILNDGLNLSFLSSLGNEAGWLTSYNFGLNYSHGNSYGKNSIEMSYMFHWRWAARFLINASPYIEIGKQVKSGVSKDVYGIGTKLGVSLLPEGWIRIPLEINFTVKTPLNLYDPNKLKTSKDENSQTYELSIGLAFL